jgi:hypothetical protein
MRFTYFLVVPFIAACEVAAICPGFNFAIGNVIQLSTNPVLNRCKSPSAYILQVFSNNFLKGTSMMIVAISTIVSLPIRTHAPRGFLAARLPQYCSIVIQALRQGSCKSISLLITYLMCKMGLTMSLNYSATTAVPTRIQVNVATT